MKDSMRRRITGGAVVLLAGVALLAQQKPPAPAWVDPDRGPTGTT